MWGHEIEAARGSLNSTVLVRHPDTKKLHVNFDRKISELLRDIQVMKGMGIEVSTKALNIYTQKATILEKYNAVNVSHDILLQYCVCMLYVHVERITIYQC